MVRCREYEPRDYEQIKAWLTSRGSHVFHPDVLPPHGFIVDGVAAMFIYETWKSPFCYLENMVTNQDASSDQRHLALSLITTACVEKARELGFKFAMAVTDEPTVIVRAVKHGAKTQTGKTLLTLQLS